MTSVYATPGLQRQIFCDTNHFPTVNHKVILPGNNDTKCKDIELLQYSNTKSCTYSSSAPDDGRVTPQTSTALKRKKRYSIAHNKDYEFVASRWVLYMTFTKYSVLFMMLQPSATEYFIQIQH
jgi:hypothetical protein